MVSHSKNHLCLFSHFHRVHLIILQNLKLHMSCALQGCLRVITVKTTICESVGVRYSSFVSTHNDKNGKRGTEPKLWGTQTHISQCDLDPGLPHAKCHLNLSSHLATILQHDQTMTKQRWSYCTLTAIWTLFTIWVQCNSKNSCIPSFSAATENDS